MSADTHTTSSRISRDDLPAGAAETLRIVTGTVVLAPVGGLEVCIFEDTQALAARGHDLHVLFHEDGVQGRELTMLGVRLSGPFAFQFDADAWARLLPAFVRTALFVRKQRADVLWLNRPEHIIWAQIVARLARIPLVVHLHHAPNYRLERQMMTGVTRYVAVSEYMKTVWAEKGIPERRIRVVANALPPGAYPYADGSATTAARVALGLDPDARVVLQYGRIARSKGVLTVLEAWAALALDPAEAVLVLAGVAEPDPELAAAIAVMPAGSVIQLPNQNDVVPLLHAADVVVAPSWTPESFGRVLIEPMATGRPAIGADFGGMAEVLGGELARFAVPVHDAAALASRLRELLHWRETEPELGLRLRDLVEERFPYDAHVEGLERVLLEAKEAYAARGTRRFARFLHSLSPLRASRPFRPSRPRKPHQR